MMKVEVKQKLIKALRSGEYKKALGQLKDGDCFCVNGVLCDLAAKEGVGFWQGNMFNVNGKHKTILLPVEVASWASGNPLAINDDYAESIMADDKCLMNHNDSGWSFDDMAEMLESAEKVDFYYGEDK